MLYAVTNNDQRITASPSARAYCPNCGQEVIAKCGEINIWHWAHKSSDNCDPWSEGESQWHLEWKKHFIPKCVEVIIEKNGQRHIADIVRADGTVVELQASYISPEEIRVREAFYDKMVWLFDAREVVTEDTEKSQEPRLELRRRKGNIYTFRWRHPRKHMGMTQSPAYLDFGSLGIFRLEKLHLEGGPPYGGWGKLFGRPRFFNWLHSTASNY